MSRIFSYARPIAAASPLALWACPGQGAQERQRGSFQGRLRHELGPWLRLSSVMHGPVHCSVSGRLASLPKQDFAEYPSEAATLKFTGIDDVMRWLEADTRLVQTLEFVVGPLGNSIRKLGSLSHNVVFDGLCAAHVDGRKLHPTEAQDLAMAWGICRRAVWVRAGNDWSAYTHVNATEQADATTSAVAAMAPAGIASRKEANRGIRLVQLKSPEGVRQVALVANDGTAKLLKGVTSIYDFAQLALKKGVPLPKAVADQPLGEAVDYAAALQQGRVLSPIDHPDPAHCLVTGTGLTHLGSAAGRDKMHKKVKDSQDLTDSMKMFKMGLEKGKPEAGAVGVQPEWFYKGNGSTLVAPGGSFQMPSFALDGGEEPEIAGIYIIGPDGEPHRIGFALGNEFSDHIMEKQNYLYLAHSKLRQCSVGPELLVGPLPDHVEGMSRIIREGKTEWEKPFVSGESNMSHTLSNLEHHHFKYDLFRNPGDVHVHFFGTGTLSFSDGVQPQAGDVFEVEVKDFGMPLRNTLKAATCAETLATCVDFNLSGGQLPSGRALIGLQYGDASTPFSSTEIDADRACDLAGRVSAAYAAVPSADRAAFLDAIAKEIEDLGDVLVERVMEESHLPEGRVKMERGRTCSQLRMFAQTIREGSWAQVRLDVDADKDLRRMAVPLGPVVVFAASNFPLAFSTAGGDTASALAAGCPVVMNAHPAHPRTSELVGLAVRRAALATKMPDGVFSMVYGRVGLQLVKHPVIKAVGFTGSHKAGRMFLDAAAARAEPIPVFAEMGSINPVFVLPEKLKGDGASQLATTLAGSITLGAGQFCTNPGAIVIVDSPDARRFVKLLGEKIAAAPTAPMLTSVIRDNYRKTVNDLVSFGAKVVASGAGSDPGRATLLSAPASKLVADPDLKLAEECFGPSSCIFVASCSEEMVEVAAKMGGQLTATVFATETDLATHPEVVPAVTQKVGRVVFNAAPTGVVVCESMQHGGPYPASTDSRSTSVGTAAIERFARPVCYQAMPAQLQPLELRDENPLGIMRIVNGKRTRDALEKPAKK